MKNKSKYIIMILCCLLAISVIFYGFASLWMFEYLDTTSLKKVIVMNEEGDVIAVHNGEFSIVYLNNGIRFYQGDKHYTYQNAIIEVIDYD